MPDNVFASRNLKELASSRFSVASEVPIALSPDSQIWERPDDAGVVRAQAEEFVAMQVAGYRSVYDALHDLVDDMAGLGVDTATGQAPPQVLGRLTQPDGTPAVRLQITLNAVGLSTDDARNATAVTGEDGSFVLPIPRSLRSIEGAAADLVVTGGNKPRAAGPGSVTSWPCSGRPPPSRAARSRPGSSRCGTARVSPDLLQDFFRKVTFDTCQPRTAGSATPASSPPWPTRSAWGSSNSSRSPGR